MAIARAESSDAARVLKDRSDSDRLPVLREKMREWIANVAQLGWLFDPSRRAVETFRPGSEPEIREEATHVRGDGPITGFVLDLTAVWTPQS